MQPQDRRSPHAGDSQEAVDARARSLAAGVGRSTQDEVIKRAAALELGDNPAVADLGCGSGELLGGLASRRPIIGVGIDLSTYAATRAARAFPDLTWVVANADRRLPILDRSLDLVVSQHGRRNATECARVLSPGRFVMLTVPAHDDLIELRREVQGQRADRDRTEALLTEFGARFTLTHRDTIREHHTLDRAALLDLLKGTYRGERRSTASRIAELTELGVTMASEVLILQVV